MLNRQIIYHANCHDGFASAWLCHLVWPDAEFIPSHPDWTPPDTTDKDVIITDLSYSRKSTLELKAKAKSLVVLDHHKTADINLIGLDFCIIDKTRSGARLTWDYLIGHGLLQPQKFWPALSFDRWQGRISPHWLIAYVEDRDLWVKCLPHTNEINAVIRSFSTDFAVWDTLARSTADEAFIAEGRGICRYQEMIFAHHLRYLETVEINGLIGKGCCCSTGKIWSELMARILAQEGCAFAIVWIDTKENIRIYSLRSAKDGPDVEVIAAKFGGGGHEHAAGFRVPLLLQFIPESHPVHLDRLSNT